MDLIVTGPVLTASDTVSFIISYFLFKGEITSVMSPPCLVHCIGGLGSPVTVHMNTANADWLRTEPVGTMKAVTFG